MTDQEIAAMKHNIEDQLKEYEQAVAAAKAWYAGWKARQGFRCVERQSDTSGA